MRGLLCISILFFGAATLSLTTRTPINTDGWTLSYNSKLIFLAHSLQPDSTVVINIKNSNDTDSIRYSYHPCLQDHTQYLAKLYLVSPKKEKFLVSTQKSTGNWFGNFSVKTLESLADSCMCTDFQLEEVLTDSWNEKKKRDKRRTPSETSVMVKIRVIR